METYYDVGKKINVYSAGELAMMRANQLWRGQMFLPLLKVLVSLRVTPNQLTYFSLCCGIAFCGVFQFDLPEVKFIAFVLLGLHVLLDGLDGPLARYTGTASLKGSLTDSFSDQLVVAFSTIALIHSGEISVLPGGLYLFLYTLVVVFAMLRNALSIPYTWLIRPRFFVYGWFLIEVYLLPGSLDYILWICTGFLSVNMVPGFLEIRKKL